MKKCPSCGYMNPGRAEACSVCGLGLPPVPEALPPPVPGRMSAVLPAALLLLCALFVFSRFDARSGTRPARAPYSPSTPSRHGVVRSLERMSEQRYLPDEDKLRVLPLLSGPGEDVRLAAAKAAGAWLRSGSAGGTGRQLFEGLLKAAGTGSTAVRRQAALEAAFAAASGFDSVQYTDSMLRAAFTLSAGADPELRGAGFILGSMAGAGRMTPRIRASFGDAGDPALRQDAACALSLLGEEQGQAFLATAASGGPGARGEEALTCLALSSFPREGRALAAGSGVKQGLLQRNSRGE